MKLKYLLTFILFLIVSFKANKSLAQSTTSPDTVCAGNPSSAYYVTGAPGSTYYWIVPNGNILSGNNTDSINVEWSSTPGIDTIKVVEVNKHGCVGDTQRLPVYRMPLPFASLAGVDSLCFNNSGTSFNVSFTGIGPWNFTYSNGSVSTTYTNISSNPYTVNIGTQSTTATYRITAISNKFGCAGSPIGSGRHIVVVNPKPATLAIYHN